jgi:hypothetical protein
MNIYVSIIKSFSTKIFYKNCFIQKNFLMLEKIEIFISKLVKTYLINE